MDKKTATRPWNRLRNVVGEWWYRSLIAVAEAALRLDDLFSTGKRALCAHKRRCARRRRASGWRYTRPED